MNETKPKKMVSRNVAIALGIICIVLIALIAYFTVTGISAQNSYNTLRDQNNQLQANNTNLQTQVIAENETIDQENATIIYDSSQMALLLSQLNDMSTQVGLLNDIINLKFSTTWVNNQVISQPANSSTSWNFSANDTGFVLVSVYSSTNDTFVELSYSHNGWANYNNTVNIGSNGTTWFPVLPANIEIRVGNTNSSVGATETVTIGYTY